MRDINLFTDSDVYESRYEIAMAIVSARGLIRLYGQDPDSRAQGNALRAQVDAAESRLLSVTRPR